MTSRTDLVAQSAVSMRTNCDGDLMLDCCVSVLEFIYFRNK